VRAKNLSPFRVGEITVRLDFRLFRSDAAADGRSVCFNAPVCAILPSAIRPVRHRGAVKLRWRQLRTGYDRPGSVAFVGTFNAQFYWRFEGVAVLVRLATKSVAALAFLAKEAAPRPSPLTDQAPLQVEAGVAALGAEGVMVVDGGRGQFH